MTTELLDELQALLDAGTPGHWDGQAGYLTMEDKVLLLGWDKCDEDLENAENNCLLIAKLKNATPALLSAARENLRLREALENMQCVCPECGGDGKETCTNPDHGIIFAIGDETGRHGCPVCGHDEHHKVKNGGPCFQCDGKGAVTLRVQLNTVAMTSRRSLDTIATSSTNWTPPVKPSPSPELYCYNNKTMNTSNRNEGDLITVCDKCLQASCWQGIFLCDRAINAGVVQITVADLRTLDREHESYWKTDKELSGMDDDLDEPLPTPQSCSMEDSCESCS